MESPVKESTLQHGKGGYTRVSKQFGPEEHGRTKADDEDCPAQLE